jgi:hypothetical protein
MCLFAIGIEHPLDVTVQRLHDPDPSQHGYRRHIDGIGGTVADKDAGENRPPLR